MGMHYFVGSYSLVFYLQCHLSVSTGHLLLSVLSCGWTSFVSCSACSRNLSLHCCDEVACIDCLLVGKHVPSSFGNFLSMFVVTCLLYTELNHVMFCFLLRLSLLLFQLWPLWVGLYFSLCVCMYVCVYVCVYPCLCNGPWNANGFG